MESRSETKSMGSFISALRRAKGMTQRALAEELHVSDKSISRWERDEGAPDLSVLPALAEVLGVTADELLRGERRTAPPSEAAEERKEVRIARIAAGAKQRAALLCGIAVFCDVLGILIALLCNNAFLRGLIGFYLACLCFLPAIALTVLSLPASFRLIEGEHRSHPLCQSAKRGIFKIASLSFSATLLSFAALLPLATTLRDIYFGLTPDTLAALGLQNAAIAAAVAFLLIRLLRAILIVKDIYPSPERAITPALLRTLPAHLGLIAAALLVGFLLSQTAASLLDPFTLADKTTFRTKEAFLAYIERSSPDVENPPIVNENEDVVIEEENVIISPDKEVIFDAPLNPDGTPPIVWESNGDLYALCAPNGTYFFSYANPRNALVRVDFNEAMDQIVLITVCEQEDFQSMRTLCDALCVLPVLIPIVASAWCICRYLKHKKRLLQENRAE